MKKFVSLIFLFLCLSFVASAQTAVCPFNVISSSTSSAVLITPSSGKAVRICKVTVNIVQSGTPSNFSLISGTGSVCGTGTANLTLLFAGVANTTQVYDYAFDSSMILRAAKDAQVCLNLSASPTTLSVQVFYGLY